MYLGTPWLVVRGLVAAVAVALLLPLLAGSVEAHHHAPIQPGAQILTTMGPCTMAFIFADNKDVLYTGTASHCVSEVGERVATSGGVPFGTVVWKGRYQHPDLGKREADFALIRIDDGAHASVNPALRVWGGPSEIETGFATGQGTLHYGWSIGFATVEPTRPRAGVLVDYYPNGAYRGYWAAAHPMFQGDSGSPVITEEGTALGIATHARVGGRGTIEGPTLVRILDDLHRDGFAQLHLVTAPYVSPLQFSWGHARGVLRQMVDHCHQDPVGGPDSCVKP